MVANSIVWMEEIKVGGRGNGSLGNGKVEEMAER